MAHWLLPGIAYSTQFPVARQRSSITPLVRLDGHARSVTDRPTPSKHQHRPAPLASCYTEQMAKASWYCRSDQHQKCSGRRLKDRLGPVQMENCKCQCHKDPYALRCGVCEGIDYPGLSHNTDSPECSKYRCLGKYCSRGCCAPATTKE